MEGQNGDINGAISIQYAGLEPAKQDDVHAINTTTASAISAGLHKEAADVLEQQKDATEQVSSGGE